MARPQAKAAAPRAPSPVQAPEAIPQAAPPRAAPQPVAQQFVVPHGRAVAVGRDGQPLYRQTSMGVSDPYAIDPAIVPPGWVYQWKRYSILNQPDHNYQATIQRVGRWSAVPAERHDGLFLPPGTKGAIMQDGLLLMERPLALEMEAQREDKMNADNALRMAKSKHLVAPAGAGVDVNTPAARAATYVRTERVTPEEVAAMGEVPRTPYDYNRQSID